MLSVKDGARIWIVSLDMDRKEILKQIRFAAYKNELDKASKLYAENRCISEQDYLEAVKFGKHQRILRNVKDLTDKLKKVMPKLQTGG